MKIERVVVDNKDTMGPDGGAAYVEFLMAFIPLFIMFLGMVQMCLMYAGDLVVQHAASRASRAAAVVLDDDPEYYDGARRRQIDTSGSSSESPLGALIRLFSGGSGGSGPPAAGGARLAAIRTAASMPLAAISPSLNQIFRTDQESIRQAIDSPETRAATGVFLYNEAAMAVTFPQGPGSTSYRTSWDHGDQVTTRVTYLFHCGIPLVNRMMCRSYGALGAGGESAAMGEIATAGTSGALAGSLGSFFKVMRGEATMPLQSAHYEY